MTWPSGAQLIPWLLGAHLAMALLAPLVARRLRQRTFLVAALVPLSTLVWVAFNAPSILDDGPIATSIAWAPSLGFELAFRVDAFSVVMVGLVSGVGTAVFAYSSVYFGPRVDIGRLIGLLVAFAGAMTGLVLSDNLLGLFLFWELTSVTSYLLIGIDDTRAGSRSAALRALLTTAAGGLAMLAGFILLSQASGTYSISEILASPPDGPLVEVALVLVLIGALTKSAQFPFHFWLPGAMAAPTPISAYLHSATMVKAGVYLIARFAPAFADAAVWRPIVLTAGLLTMLIGGWAALRQWDLKLLLAHGTVSQLGLMVVLFGVGLDEATTAGVAILLAHGMFKAALFLVVGAIDRRAGTRDLRRLDGIGRSMKGLAIAGVVAAASMAGLPPVFGFVAKESALEALIDADQSWIVAVLVLIVVGSALTAGYSIRFVWGAFASKPRAELGDDPVRTVEPVGVGLAWAPMVLGVLTVLVGLIPLLVTRLIVDGARSLDPLVGDVYLSLWHGFNLALGLSALALAAGVVLWTQRRHVVAAGTGRLTIPSGASSFDLGLRSLLRGADTITGHVQTGSLPIYMMVILTTVLSVPLAALLLDRSWSLNGADLIDRPVQLVVGVVLVVCTVAALRARQRLTAAIAVGAVGYGIAVLFVVQGAPDLALTQLLVETLLLVIFVLVLRHLPLEFDSMGTAMARVPRVLISIGSGAVVALFTLVASSARTTAPASDQMIMRALPDAEGSNVVNVILVDFRAFDTFGEITVVTVAALGIMGLVRAARRERQRRHDIAPVQRFRPSPILDAAVRVLFHTLLLFSVVMLAVGHNDPGGGFIAGLVAGSAFVLVFLAGGAPQVRRAEPVPAEALLGFGITAAATAGVWGIVAGGEFLSRASASLTAPLLGTIKLTSGFVFDIGVYLVVVGLVIAILRSLGREEVRFA